MRPGRRVRVALWLALAPIAALGSGGFGVLRAAQAEDRPPVVPPAVPPAPAAPTPAPVEGFDFEPLPSFASRLQTALPSKRADPLKRQRAIESALEWLAVHQAPDGGWRPHELTWCRGTKGTIHVEGPGKDLYEVGVTGVALAAFLMVGIGPSADHPHAPTVRKALDFLCQRQDPEGCFGPRTTQHYVYNHAFACLAVLEAYGMTGERSLGVSARKGLDFCLLAQNPGAGWRYGVRPGDNDTSATVAMGACLSVAHAINDGVAAAGGVEPLMFPEEAVQGMHDWFDRMTDGPSGRLGYMSRGNGSARTVELVDKFPAELVEPMTAGVVLLRRILPGPVAPSPALEVRSVALLRALPPEWSVERGTIDFLYWYYGTLALSVVGGPAWEEWDAALGAALPGAQRNDGTVCDVRGSWDPADAWGLDAGRMYATAFGVLALAGVNRYRPIPRADLLTALRTKGLAPHLQALAARAVSALGLELEEAAAVALARSPSVEVRSAAPALLARGTVRDASLKALADLLADPAPAVSVASLRAVDGAEAWRVRLVEPIAGLLGDMRMDLTARALLALRHTGPAAAPAAPRVVPLLAHPDARVRGEALRCLWRIGGDRTSLRAPIVQMLKDGAPEERRWTLAVLEAPEVGPEGLTEAVRACLAAEASAVAVEAARLLRDGPDAAAALAATLKALAAPEHEARLAGLTLLATWAPGTALPTDSVAPLAVTGPRGLRLEAVRALARTGSLTPLSLSALTAASTHSHPPLAKAAEAALTQIAVPAPERAQLYATALRGKPGPELRRGALLGLERLSGEAVPHLRALLLSGGLTDEVLAQVLAVLGRLGPLSKPALADVVQALETGGSSVVRSAAAGALGEPGISGPSAVAPVVRGAGERDSHVSEACMRALVRLARREEEAVPEVERLLKVPGKDLPRSARTVLDELARWPDAAARVSKTLVRLLGHEASDAAWAACDALAPMRGEAVKLLLPVIDPKAGPSQDARVGMAVRTLEKIGREAEPAGPSLLVLLTTRQLEAAADALGAIGKPAVSGLTRALADGNVLVRAWAARALGRVGPDAASAAAALRRALKDPEAIVRTAAAAALLRVK